MWVNVIENEICNVKLSPSANFWGDDPLSPGHYGPASCNIPEAYKEPTMELFAKILNSFQPLTIFAKSSVLDV